jgi:pimeloyl-ACP methyl ester carboxylesterase
MSSVIPKFVSHLPTNLNSMSHEDFIEAGKYKFHYSRWGEKGSKLVLLHSMGMDEHSMDLLAEKLKPHNRILALTLLGHGDSSVPKEKVSLKEHAELIRECIRKLDFRGCVLIGHSVGGRLSMILAADHPSEFKGVILVDIVPPDLPAQPWSQPTPKPFGSEGEVLEWLRKRYPNFKDEYIENRLKYGFIKQSDGSLKAKPMGTASMSSRDTDLWPYVEKIRIPTLLIAGSDSNIVTPEKIERMKKLIPGFELVTLRDATHMVPQDQPVEFERTVRGFVKQVEK